jgi:hypothetical protein
MKHAHPVLLDRHVVIGDRHVDPAALNRLAVNRMPRGERAGAAEDLRQDAAAARHVQDDEDCRLEVARQTGDERADRFHAAGGRANDDHVVCRHDLNDCIFRALSSTAAALSGNA